MLICPGSSSKAVFPLPHFSSLCDIGVFSDWVHFLRKGPPEIPGGLDGFLFRENQTRLCDYCLSY